MFDRILDNLSKLWDFLKFCQIIKVYETGVVLRWGKVHRKVEPGLVWKWPVFEDLIEANSVLTTLRLSPQTLTTADGQSVVVTAIVKYWIEDIELYTTKIWDAVDVLADETMGTVRERIQKTSWADALVGDLANEITITVRRAVKPFGFGISRITFIDFGRVRSIRLIQPSGASLDN